MSGGAVAHPDPWTVEDLYALPDDGMRHELLDGTLLVTPPPSVTHQVAAYRIRQLLADAAPQDVEVVEGVGVAVPSGLLIPDVVVARAAAVHAGPRQLESNDVLAVVEIVSPSSHAADRRWKPQAYAEAGIDVFWRVELEAQGGPEVTAYARSGSGWTEVTRVTAEKTATIEAPFPVRITPARLVGPRR
jgi:Uma2 family endonuclease